LLRDVLELRAAGWKDKRPKKVEGPATLAAVAKQQAEDPTAPRAGPKNPWKQQEQQQAQFEFYPGMWDPAMWCWDPSICYQYSAYETGSAVSSEAAASSQASAPAEPARAPFSILSWRSLCDEVLAELRTSADVCEAAKKLAASVPPSKNQATALVEWLALVIQEDSRDTRCAGFETLVAVVQDEQWSDSCLTECLDVFVWQWYPDLCEDFPGLPEVLASEIFPVVQPLVGSEFVQLLRQG
jgi:hypothetical protein